MKHITPTFINTFVIWSLIFLSNCNQGDGENPQPQVPSSLITDQIDLKHFEQLTTSANLLNENNIWEGYPFSSYQHYLIRLEGNKPTKGFIINPSSSIAGSQKVELASTSDMEVYRFDGIIKEAFEHLFAGNGLFDFDYEINGDKYYLQTYSEQDVEDGEALAVNVHENFHFYQFGWAEKSSSFQDFDNFPVQRELLELQLLTVEILRGVEKVNDKAQLRDLLKQYVALRTEEIRLDPTQNGLITNHSNYQELVEGTAKYIEVKTLVNSSLFPNATFEFVNTATLDRNGITSKNSVRELMGQLVFYDTGSAVTYILAELGIDIKRLENNQYPYDLATELLGMSSLESAQALEAAKMHSLWAEIQTKAASWAALD